MPTIEISQQQATNLAAGKDITITTTSRDKNYIVIFPNGAIYDFRGHLTSSSGNLISSSYRLIRPDKNSRCIVGKIYKNRYHFLNWDATIVEVHERNLIDD